MHAFRYRRTTDNPDSLDGGRKGDSENRCVRNRNGCDAGVLDTEEEAPAGAPQHHQHTRGQSVVVELLHRNAVLQLLSRQSARCARNVVLGVFRSVISVVRVVGGTVTSVSVSCSRICPLLKGRGFDFFYDASRRFVVVVVVVAIATAAAAVVIAVVVLIDGSALHFSVFQQRIVACC